MEKIIEANNLISCYQHLPIKVFYRRGKLKTDTTLILNPGAFEKAFGDDERYKHILLWLQNNLTCKPNIVWYETARLVDPKINLQNKGEYWKNIFFGKKFYHELDDVRRVYKSIKTKKIYILGFSLGGTLGMILSSEFSAIKKICVIGSAISTKRKHFPVLTGYPPKRQIIKILQEYKYDFNILQGSEEEVVPIHDASLIIQSLKQANRTIYTRIKGANHMFSGKNMYGLIRGKKLLTYIKNFFEEDI